MKYRIGDKVRIKIWEEMKEEFGLTELGSINSDLYYTQQMELRLNSLGLDRAIKISAVNEKKNCYYISKFDRCWTDDMIEGLVE